MSTTRRDAPDPTVPAADLLAAAGAFFPDAASVAAVEGHEALLRVEGADGAGSWKIRRWPEETTEGRVAFVHDVLARAREDGVTAPSVAALPATDGTGTILVIDGRRYDAQGWLPGRPALPPPAYTLPGVTDHVPAVLPEETVAEAARAIAHLHRATFALAGQRGAPAATLAGLIPAVRRAWAMRRERLRPVAPRRPEVQRWLAIGERVLPAAQAALEASPVTGYPPRGVLHLGLWPAHLLLPPRPRAEAKAGAGAGADQVSGPLGLIGWEGAAAGSPLLDLAQLVVRCRGWSAGAAELAIAAYGEIWPLAPEERRLLPAVAALDLVASAGLVLDLAFGPGGDGAPPSRLRGAATSLVNSLEVVAGVVAQGDRPIKLGRRWEYGPRRGPAPTRPGGGARRPARSDRAPSGPNRGSDRPGPRKGGGRRSGG